MTISCIPKRAVIKIINMLYRVLLRREKFKFSPIKLILFWYFYFAEVDDEGIERDSEEIDDEKFLDSKELDHILEVSWVFLCYYCNFDKTAKQQ